MDDTPNENGKIHLRQFQGPSDFDIIAHIHNQSAVTHYGDGATLVEGVIMEDMISSSERLQIAEIDKIPVGLIFVIKEGRMHLAMKGVAVKAVLLTPFPLSLLYRQDKDTLTFSETLCPSLYLAGFPDKPEIIALIKEFKEIFPSFYYYNMGDVEEKYRLSKELGLSAEEIFDLRERSKEVVQ